MLNLELTKPIVFFDVETTGLNIVRDRIIQIALIKYNPGQETPEEWTALINPEMAIPEDSQKIHGISNEMVADKPTFGELASELYAFIGNADLGGYNSDRFDIPMLMEEFARVGIDFSLENRKSVDVQKIFYKMEPRTLSAAYQYYCDKDLVDAHDALVDVKATIDVLNGQLDMYTDDSRQVKRQFGPDANSPVQNNVDALASFIQDSSVVDATMRLKRNAQNVIVFNFGKHVGKPVGETLAKDPQYMDWMLKKDFSSQVKSMIVKIRDAYVEQNK